MMDKIIIVDDINFIKANIKEIRRIAGHKKALLIPTSDAALLFLKNEDISCIDYHQFEKAGMYDDVYSTAKRWATNWYKPKGTDLTAVNSYSLGRLIEWSMIYFFSHLLRSYLSIVEVLKNMDPEEVIFITSGNTVSKQNSIILQRADIFSLGRVLEAAILEVNPSIKLNIIKLSEDGNRKKDKPDYFRTALLYLALPLLGLCRIYARIFDKRPKIMFFEGFRHFDNVMKSAFLKEFQLVHLQKTIGPTLFLKLIKRGILIESFMINRPKKMGEIRLYPAAAEQELDNFFIYRKNNLLRCISPRLKYLFENYFLRTYADICAAVKIMKKIKPSCLVVENGSTYYEKLLVTVARQMDVYTVVIQDGASYVNDSHKNDDLATHNFYPLSAHRFFSFGDVTKDWLITKDIPPEKMVVTGAPRFDKYYGTRSTRTSSSKRVLIILSDIWIMEGVVTDHMRLSVIYKHLKKFIDLAKNNVKIQFIIRPHDENNIWNQIFFKELGQTGNVTISRSEPLEDILQNVDLVIGCVSTVLIEALIYRVPVISMDTGDFYNSLPLWSYGLSARVPSFEELDEAMNKILFSEKEKTLAVNNMEKNLRLFNYNDDGRASERVAKALNQIIHDKAAGKINL